MGRSGVSSKPQAVNNLVSGLLSVTGPANLRVLRPMGVVLPKLFFVADGVVDYAHGRHLSVNRDYTKALEQVGFPRKAKVLLEDLTHGISYVTSMRKVGNRYYIYIPKAMTKLYNKDEQVMGFVTPIEVIEW